MASMTQNSWSHFRRWHWVLRARSLLACPGWLTSATSILAGSPTLSVWMNTPNSYCSQFLPNTTLICCHVPCGACSIPPATSGIRSLAIHLHMLAVLWSHWLQTHWYGSSNYHWDPLSATNITLRSLTSWISTVRSCGLVRLIQTSAWLHGLSNRVWSYQSSPGYAECAFAFWCLLPLLGCLYRILGNSLWMQEFHCRSRWARQ